jgi:hypothetical protein
MANQNATLAAARASTPQALPTMNQQGGEVNVFFSTVTNPSAGGVAIGEYISWGFLPLGARVLLGILTYSAGAASSTLNLGDPAIAVRYLAATSVTTAGNTVFTPATFANGLAGFVVSVAAPGLATDQTELRSTCAGAGLQANQTLSLMLLYVTNQ